VTLQTVADRVGVSRMTVSNAFSRPDQLSPGLRARIMEVAEELGYVGPDPAARTLARGTTGTVGVLLTDSLGAAFSDEVATSFIGAIADELTVTGLSLTLLSATAGEDSVPARDAAMDGAIVYSCNPDSSAVDWLSRRRLPMVFVDQAPSGGVASVNVEDRAGARAAAQHLVDLGHQHIGILTNGMNGPHGIIDNPLRLRDVHVLSERMRGWLDALSAAGASSIVARQKHGSDEAAYDGARLLLDREDRPTGILCFSDRMAYEAIRAAHDLGLSVPHDVSVVGFDDTLLAQRVRPALTTVRQDVRAKGKAAAAALIRAMKQARDGVPGRVRHLQLPTQLVVRESTDKPAP
jgi:DNA-binding LacI/PurR family transcriptional regulator